MRDNREAHQALFGETCTGRAPEPAVVRGDDTLYAHSIMDDALRENRLEPVPKSRNPLQFLLQRCLGRRGLFGVTRRVIWRDSDR